LGVSGSCAAVGVVAGALPSRALNEQVLWARVLGMVGVGAAGGLLLALNWAAAKFRDIAATGGDVESVLQISKLATAEWNLTVPGLAVFCCGLANGIYCWWKAYRAFDPVLGFDRQARAYQAKRDAVQDLEANIDGRLLQILSRSVAYGRDRPVAITAELQNHKRETTGLEIAKRRNQELDESDVKALIGAIGAYRSTYKYVRHDGVVPECLAGDIDVAQHHRDYAALNIIGDMIEAARSNQKQQAESWIAQIDELQAIAKHDPNAGPVPELVAIRNRFRAVGQGSHDTKDNDGEAPDFEDGSEPWETEKGAAA
jgi:hypothetical protein